MVRAMRAPSPQGQTESFGESHLAPFATFASRSRGRLHDEPPPSERSAFQRDRDRVLHSGAFRRMKHKTQVFVYHEGDYYRTRLTHSLEVAQIGRSVARSLGLNEDLTEALALAHDLGHTPFGHAGERALDRVMRDFGGFDHNAQTLRILTRLESRYAAFDGLNLTWEMLEGVVKHNGPVTQGRDGGPVPVAIVEYQALQDLELATWPGPEAQVAALCDDIAYNSHDLDDGLRAGLFDLDDLGEVPWVGAVIDEVRSAHPGLEPVRTTHECVRRLIDMMVADLLAETRGRLAAARPRSVEDVRAHDGALVGFSEAMRIQDKQLKAFLWTRMYRHYRVNRMSAQARRVVEELFHALTAEPDMLPPEWSNACIDATEAKQARVVADYIAGMTDRFAMTEHRRLFDLSVIP